MTEQNGPLAGLRVLVAEDEYLIVRELRRILTQAGCPDIRVAGNLADAERLAGDGAPNLALLDIKLGEQEVYQLAERLDRGGVATAFVTGYATEVVPNHLTHIPLIQKPFPRRRLLQTLHQLAARVPRGDGG